MVSQGLVPSRERAQALIIAGRVMVNEQKINKSGVNVNSDAVIRLLGDDLRYVSRGGLKLERALEHWQIDLTGKHCLDIGTSTGGFTDCMLQHGAASVVGIDTGYGQIDVKLRSDPRVRLLERTNARYLKKEMVPGSFDFVAMDVAFISATLVLPAVLAASIKGGGELVVLVKPQFEVGKHAIGKGGIVRDEAAQQSAVERVRTTVIESGGTGLDVIDSPILGTEGNREFLLRAIYPKAVHE